MLFLIDVDHGYYEKRQNRHGGNPPICRVLITWCAGSSLVFWGKDAAALI